MRRLVTVLGFVAAILLCGTCSILRAQVPTLPAGAIADTSVVIDNIVRAALDVRWDDSSATQSERGFCLAVEIEHIGPYVVFRASDVAFPRSHASSQYAVMFTCTGLFPMATLVVPGHTHPPATCAVTAKRIPIASSCVIGGDAAWDCVPSSGDRRYLARTHDLFNVLQCDRHAVIVYWNAAPFVFPVPPVHAPVAAKESHDQSRR